MLTIAKELSGDTLDVKLTGRLDSATASQFENEVNNHLDGVNNLNIDCEGLEYISSAGLRVFLSACKEIGTRGTHTIKNCNEVVTGIFEVTKLTALLNIQ